MRGRKVVRYLLRSLIFLDKHSGLISSVGLVLAGVGVLLTLRYLRLYSREIRKSEQEQERLAWERILKLLHQVIKYAAEAHVSSVAHSPLAQQTGSLPPYVAARYGRATENLASYWHQLRVELSMMPDSPLIEEVVRFTSKYDTSADARASAQFQTDVVPIALKISQRAQRSFGEAKPGDGRQPAK